MISYQVIEHGQPLQKVLASTPQPQGSEVLMRVTRAGVCHSDLHIWEGFFDLGGGKRFYVKERGCVPPFTMGHEPLGIVEALGPKAKGVKVDTESVAQTDTDFTAIVNKTANDKVVFLLTQIATQSQQFAQDAELRDRMQDVNPNGGGISLGHPLGATGARVTATLLGELDRRDARYGVACMCIGFGMAIAAVVERLGPPA